MGLPSSDMATFLEAREQLYAAIGKVASNWAAFELLVNSSLWVLAKVDDKPGACLTAQIPNISRSLDAFASLVALRGGDGNLISKINKFAEKTGKLARRRNRVIHDPWNWDQETGQQHRLEISAQKKLVFGKNPMETEEVRKLIDEIYEHIQQFDSIISEVSVQLGTFAGIRFRPFSEQSAFGQ